ESGAVVPGFQREALTCARTALLESGPGHATRCADTPFASLYQGERRRLLDHGLPAQDIKQRLEDLNLGRLRVASKGVERPADGDDVDVLEVLPESAQAERGMYMMGDVASLRHDVVSMAELHESVSAGATEWLSSLAREERSPWQDSARDDVAIIGMA